MLVDFVSSYFLNNVNFFSFICCYRKCSHFPCFPFALPFVDGDSNLSLVSTSFIIHACPMHMPLKDCFVWDLGSISRLSSILKTFVTLLGQLRVQPEILQNLRNALSIFFLSQSHPSSFPAAPLFRVSETLSWGSAGAQGAHTAGTVLCCCGTLTARGQAFQTKEKIHLGNSLPSESLLWDWLFSMTTQLVQTSELACILSL